MPRRIEARDAFEIYVTERGQVAIKQEDVLGDDPTVIRLDPADIPTVCRWLQEAAKEAEEAREEWFAKRDEEESAGAES